MRLKYSLCSLFFVIVPLVAITDGKAEDVSPKSQTAKDTAIWQDPFYTGPLGMRIWTDVTGNHRVKGRFVELLPGKIVRLQQPDGRFLRIQLDELSRADRELVRQITPG